MSQAYILALVLGFVTIVLLIEGLYVYWRDTKSAEVQRLEKRLRALERSGEADSAQAALVKERLLSDLPVLQRWLLMVPRVNVLDRLVQQSGTKRTLGDLLLLSISGLFFGVIAGIMLRWPPLLTIMATVLLAALPALRITSMRRKRLRLIESQLPEALDLMTRGIRVGHAFQAALNMVGNEGPEPIAGEFKLAAEEVSFGIPVDVALRNLVERVPSQDVNYFVMAAIIQRQTGGNLTELLTNLSTLIRDRFQLQAKIKVLAAEGKLSAWVLTLLPFGAAAIMQMTNPDYMRILFQPGSGLTLVSGALFLLILGVLAIFRIVDVEA